MNIYRETIKRYQLPRGFKMRVWREEDGGSGGYIELDKDVLAKAAALKGLKTIHWAKLIDSVLELAYVNAVEIVDRDGVGGVFYRSEEIEINGRKFQVI